MTRPQAKIVSASDKGLAVCAASARLSTTQGSALEILKEGGDGDKDRSLIAKVMASGHKSLIEHHVFSIAFDNVSVLTEQFLIEFRMASFTVKSRRYVDFSQAGYYTPAALQGALRDKYESAVAALFDAYGRLLDLGIPREDARFVLPYCFLSNLYMTVNARELVHIISAMRFGRGAGNEELESLGAQLTDQFETYYPGLIEQSRFLYEKEPTLPVGKIVASPEEAVQSVELVGAPADPQSLLQRAMEFSGRYAFPEGIPAMVRGMRPRELEALSYTYHLPEVSLACITHFARHRIQSPLFRPVFEALLRGKYILPDTVKAITEAETIYRAAFENNAKSARSLLRSGMPPAMLSYLTMSGNTQGLFLTMNARELLHFVNLRSCSRAQWEIRDMCREMLRLTTLTYPALFALYGPSCAVTGKCPEGRLSCGHPKTLSTPNG